MMGKLISLLIISVFIKQYVAKAHYYDSDYEYTLMSSFLTEVSEYFNSSNCNVIIANYPSNVTDKIMYRLINTEFKNLHLNHNPVAFPPKLNHNLNTDKQTGNRFASRFSCACSLVIYDENTSHAVMSNVDGLWWIRFYIPGGTFGSFHLFHDETNNDQTPEKLNGVTILRHGAINKRFSATHTKLKDKLFSKIPNWNKAPIIQRINPGTGEANSQYFKTYGTWNNYAVAIVYYTAEYMNASLKFETVYSPPVGGIQRPGDFPK
jgi:hypothetical protein